MTPLAPLLKSAFLLGRSADTELHPQLVSRHAGFEVRRYPPFLTAKTFVEGDCEEALEWARDLLLDYLGGHNTNDVHIPTRFPFWQEPAPGGWSLAVTLPSHLTIESAPRPITPRIRFEKHLVHQSAVLGFKSFPDEAQFEDQALRLRSLISTSGLYYATSKPVVAHAGASWSIPFQNFEVHLRVARTGADPHPLAR